ncbi:MAG: DedA family protein [Solirubrobacterales bacterium]
MILPFLTTTGDEIGGIAGKLVDLMESIGGPGVAVAVAAENLFPPIPSELILPLAGFTAGQEDANMTLVGAIFWATIGSLIGATVLYWIGYAIGRDRVRAIIMKMPLMKITDLDRTENWYVKHQTKTVFFGRMIPIFRSLISIPAGVERMKFSLFLVYTAAGSLIWNTALVVAGYQLGSRWDEVEKYVGAFQKLVVVAVIVVLAWIGWYLYKNRETKPTE